MSTLTYADLVKPMTRDQIMVEIALPIFAAYDFPVDAWGPTDEPRADIEVQCETLAGLSVTVAQTAKGGTLDADGDWLTLKADQDYGVGRKLPTATIGQVKLVDSTGSGQTFTDGQLLIVGDELGDMLFRVGAVAVPPNGEASVTVTAERVGRDYNRMGNELRLATPIAGLTLVVAPLQTWITTFGTNVESDESTRVRCRLAQAALSPDDDIENFTGHDEAYQRWALSFVAVNRVHVQEDPIAVPPAKPVTVYLAGPGGPVPPADFAIVAAYLQLRRPLGIELGVENVGDWTCVLRGPVKIKAAYLAAAWTKIVEQLEKYFSGEPIKIRDSDTAFLPGLGIGKVVLVEQIVEIIMAVDGVEGVELINPSTMLPYALGEFIGGIPAGDTVAVLDRSLLTPQAV